jgi:hypothetical protein
VVLNISLGTNKKKVQITNVEAFPVRDDNPNQRIYLSTRSSDGAEYKINEVWTKDHTGTVVVKTLWLNFDDSQEHILSTSFLGQLLKMLEVDNTAQLVGKEITVSPKENGFMAIILQ